jgi:Tol biopolymer transport system component
LSPDQSRIAFIGAGDRWPLSKLHAMLSVYDIDTERMTDLGPLEFDDEYGFTGRYTHASAPQWSPDGTRILVGDKRGIHIVPVNGDSIRTVAIEGIREARWIPKGDWEPHGEDILATDALRLYRVNCMRQTVDTLRGGSRSLGLFTSADVRGLVFSRDGSQLAFADDRKIYRMSAAGHSMEICKSGAPVYWLDWLPGDTALVFLAGKKDRIVGGGLGSRVRGTFSISIVPIGTGDATKLYDQVDYDVREVDPSLSPDGRHVVFSSRHRSSWYNLFLIATDGAGHARLTRDRGCFFPTWWSWK